MAGEIAKEGERDSKRERERDSKKERERKREREREREMTVAVGRSMAGVSGATVGVDSFDRADAPAILVADKVLGVRGYRGF